MRTRLVVQDHTEDDMLLDVEYIRIYLFDEWIVEQVNGTVDSACKG